MADIESAAASEVIPLFLEQDAIGHNRAAIIAIYKYVFTDIDYVLIVLFSEIYVKILTIIE